VELMKSAVRATFTPQVLADVGSFGGLYALDSLPPQPVLVASTDGVGTKVKLAAQLGRWTGASAMTSSTIASTTSWCRTPAHSSFMDYMASSASWSRPPSPKIVTGIAEACRPPAVCCWAAKLRRCPASTSAGAFDLAGTIVGVVDRSEAAAATTDLQRAICSLAWRRAGRTPMASR
jgi:phosphoribosylformylglycinamidine cyclo-ligase